MSEREARALTKQMRKAKSTSKSPSRNKSPSRIISGSSNKKTPEEKAPRKKSPARSPAKSPGRPKVVRSSSPNRNKSPARKKSPARTRSPARTKSPARNKSFENKSPPKLSKEVSNDVIKRISVLRDSPMSRASSQRSSAYLSSEPTESEEEESPTKERIIRNRVSRFEERVSEIKRAVAKPLNDHSNKSENLLNNIETVPLITGHKGAAIIKTFFALLVVAVVPLIALVTTFSCKKENCKPNVKIPWSSWKSYLDLETSLLFLGFIVLQTLVSLIPLFKPVTGYPASHRPLSTFRCNGVLNWLLTIAGVLGARYFKLPLTLLLEKVPLLLAPSFALALVLGIAVYFTSRPDSHAVRSNFIVEFVFGKSGSARLGPIDFKMLVFRVSLLSSLVYHLVVSLAEVERKVNYTQFSYSLLIVCFLQIFFVSDAFLFESDSVSSHYMQQEPIGYITTSLFASFPFLFATSASYLYYNKVSDNRYMIALTCVLFTIGYLIYRIGNHQKAAFRRQPILYANSDVVVSREGRNLLAGGLWGFLRHPNYLGCIIMYWSLVPLVYLHWPALILPAMVTIEHIVRIQTVEQHCKQTHSTAWSYYSNKVPYRIIPFIY